MSALRKHLGTCHCGAVRFVVELDLGQGASRCNCSICTKSAVLSAIGKPDALTLLAGEAALSSYEWGGRTAQRYFCRHCGVQCFGRGDLEELGGAYVSVNVNALDDIDPSTLSVVYWDGRHDNWQAGPGTAPWPFEPAARPGAVTDALTA